MLELTNLPITEHDDGELRCRDLDLAERLGFGRPRDIRKLVKTHAEVLEGFGNLRQVVANTGKAGRPATEYHLNRKQAIYLTTQAGTPKARAMTVRVVEVFDKYLQGKLIDVDVLETRRRLAVAEDRVAYLEDLHRYVPPPEGLLFASAVNKQFFGSCLNTMKLGGLLSDFSMEEGIMPARHRTPTGNLANVYPEPLVLRFKQLVEGAGFPMVTLTAAYERATGRMAA